MNPIADGFKISDVMMPAVAFSQSEMADIFYNLRNDDSAPMLLESCTPEEADIRMNPGADQVLEAVTAVYNRLDRTMSALVRVLNRYANTVQVVGAPFLGPNRKNNLFAYKTVTFTFSDEQTVSILFHSPGRDPLKFVPEDTLIAYRWMLNRRDITATVSPERGRDINLQTMARRIMQLVEENSQKFQERNAERKQEEERFNQLQEESAQVNSKVEALTQENADLSTRIEDIDLLIARLKERLDSKELEQQSADTSTTDPKPEDNDAASDLAKIVAAGDEAKIEHQDQLDSFFQARVIDVRNALRELGWEGKQYGKLHVNRDGKRYTMDVDTEQAGDGANSNVVGVTYVVVSNQADDTTGASTGPASFVGGTQDDLLSTPEDIAKAIDSSTSNTLKQKLEQQSTDTGATEPEDISGNGSKGSKYDKSMTMNDIAKAIRKEIADALPSGFKVSVRQNNSTGSSAIRAEITAIPEGQQLLSSEYLSHLSENGESAAFSSQRYSPEVAKALEDIKRIADQYNYDNSDSMTDYFDVNFYFNVSVDYDLISARKELELEQLQAQTEELGVVEPDTGRHINPNEVGSGEMIYWHNENGTQQVMYRGTLDDKTATVMLNGIQMTAPIEELFKNKPVDRSQPEPPPQQIDAQGVISAISPKGYAQGIYAVYDQDGRYIGDYEAGSKDEAALKAQAEKEQARVSNITLDDLDAALARDIAGSLSIIAGIDSGEEKGYNRSLFVSSIANKIKTRAKRGDTEVADAALRMVAEFNANASKPALTQRNNVWSSTGKSYQDYAASVSPAPQQEPAPQEEQQQPLAPEPQDQPPEAPAPEENTGETPVNENQNRADALNDALEQLLNETDAAKLEKDLDDLAEQAEAEGLMDELDAALNNAADRLSELLAQEAANVA